MATMTGRTATGRFAKGFSGNPKGRPAGTGWKQKLLRNREVVELQNQRYETAYALIEKLQKMQWEVVTAFQDAQFDAVIQIGKAIDAAIDKLPRLNTDG